MANGLPGLPKLTSDFPVDVVSSPGPTFEEEQARKLVRGNIQTKLDVLQKFEDRSLAESAFEVLQNAGVEAKDIIFGLGALGGKIALGAFQAAANPTDTVEAITSGRALEDFQDIIGDIWDGVKDDYNKRYIDPLRDGDFEEFARQIKDKPLSFLFDVAGAASLAGGTLKTLGKATANQAAISSLEKTGTFLQQFGQAIEPINIAKKGVRKVGDLVPNAPIIGREAYRTRAINKVGRKAFFEEAEKLKPGFEEEFYNWVESSANLTMEDYNKAFLHLTGVETLPLSQLKQSPELLKFMRSTKDLYNNPVNRELFGITDDIARKRELLPQVLDRFQKGTLNLNAEQQAILDGITTIGKDGEFLKFGGLEELPEFLFDENVVGPFNKAVYIPMLDAESKLGAAQYIGRISNKLGRPDSPFEKTISGAVIQKYLRTKDINQIADIQETARRFLVDRTNEQLVRNLGERLLNAVDPVTGEKLAKPYYLGSVPENIYQFRSGRDAAQIIDSMKNPLLGFADEDAIYKEFLGKGKAQYLFDLRKTLTRRERRIYKKSGIEDLAKSELSKAVKTRGHDGWLTSDGFFGFTDQLQNPLTQLLDDHVMVSPSTVVQQVQRAKDIARQTITGAQAGRTLEEATESSVRSLFLDGDTFKEVARHISEEAKNKLHLFNDEILSPEKLKAYNDEFINSLRQSDIFRGALKDSKSRAKILGRIKSRVNRGYSDAHKAQWAYQIPKSLADEIIGSARPMVSSNTNLKLFFDTPTNLWRTAVLNFSGRWHVNNFLGNTFLNTVAGVLNPLDYMRAGQLLSYRLAHRFPKAIGAPRAKILKLIGMTDDAFDKARALDKIMPPELKLGTFSSAENVPTRLLGTSGNNYERMLASIKESKFAYNFTKAANASADLNSLVDRFFRDAQFFKFARGQIRRESKGIINKVAKSFYASYDEMYKFIDNPNGVNLSSYVDEVNKWLPNFSLLLNRTERNVVRKIIPFYSWYKHMFSVALMVPLNHPKRTALIANFGKIGRDLQEDDFREMGLDPKDIKIAAKWLEGTIPVSKEGTKLRVLSTRAANPFSTVLEIENLGSSLHPAVKLAIERMTGVSLFTGRPLPKEVVIGPEGIPEEKLAQSLPSQALSNIPQAELFRRLINPDVETMDGEVIFRRNRVMELFKHLGININEQDVEMLKERAKAKEGRDVSRAFNSLLKRKRFKGEDNADVLNEVLRVINSQ